MAGLSGLGSHNQNRVASKPMTTVASQIHAPGITVWPVSRFRAATRGLFHAVPALLLTAASAAVYGRLHFAPTGVSNRLVDWSIAVVASPCPAAALVFGFHSVRWLLLFLWPSCVEIRADESTLTLRLGPFGTRAFDVARLDAKYPFEQTGDFEDGGFEGYLPEEEQLARFLPRITHPRATEPINRTILRFIAGSESEIAAAIRPVIERWRLRRLDGESGNQPV